MMGDVGSKDEPAEEEYVDVEFGLTDTPGRRSLVGSELIALELAELSAELAKLAASGALTEKQLASSPGSSRSWQDLDAASDGRRRMPRHTLHRRRTHSARASLTRHVQGTHATLSVSRVGPRARPRSVAAPHNVTRGFVPHHVTSLHVTSSEDEHARGMGAEDSDGSGSSMSSTKDVNINLEVEAAAFNASNDVIQTIQSGQEAEMPPMGQFLLPLITGECPESLSQILDNNYLRMKLVQHKRIIQALLSDDATRGMTTNFIQEWKQEAARKFEEEKLEAENKTAKDKRENIPEAADLAEHESIYQRDDSQDYDISEDCVNPENSDRQENPQKQEYVDQHQNPDHDEKYQEQGDLYQPQDSQLENSRGQENCDQPQNFDQDENTGIESIDELTEEFDSLDMEVKEIIDETVPSTSREYLESSDSATNSQIVKTHDDVENPDCNTSRRLSNLIGENSSPIISHSAFREFRFVIRTENSRKKGLRKKTDSKTNYQSTSSSVKKANFVNSSTNNYNSKLNNESEISPDLNKSKCLEDSNLDNSELDCDSTKNSVSTKSDCVEDSVLISSDKKINDKTDNTNLNRSDSLKNLDTTDILNNKTDNFDSSKPESLNNFDVPDSNNEKNLCVPKNVDHLKEDSDTNKSESSNNLCVAEEVDYETENFDSSKSDTSKNLCVSKNVDIKIGDSISNKDHSLRNSNYLEDIDDKNYQSSANTETKDSNSDDALMNSGFFQNHESKTVDSFVNKPESFANKPESFVNKPDSFVNKPDSSVKKPDSSVNKPDSSVKKPDSSVKKPDSSVNKPDSILNKPDSSVKKLDSSKNDDDKMNSEKVVNKASNSTKFETLKNSNLEEDLPNLVKVFCPIDIEDFGSITEEISSDYEYNPVTRGGRARVKTITRNNNRVIMSDTQTPSTSTGMSQSRMRQLGRQYKARNGGMGNLRTGLGTFGVRAVSLKDVTAVLHYVFQANRPSPLDDIKLTSTEGFSHQWRQYYESCSILTCTTASREAGLTDSEWHLRLQYGRCYCCICMFRIHNRCVILDYADFVVTQLVMAGRQTTVDAVLLLRLLELNTPNKDRLMLDYGRKSEYVMTHGTRLVRDSPSGKHDSESTQDDLQTYYHRRPPVRKALRDRKVSLIAEHVSELGLRIMASRLMEFMSLDVRVRGLFERGCCCRPFMKADLPPDKSMLGGDGSCKWALEAMVNLFDGFSYQDTRALFKMELINMGGDSDKIQAVNDTLRAGHREWDRRYYAKLYSQFSHRPVRVNGPIVTCSVCRCLCRTKAVFNTEYRKGVNDSRLMELLKESLCCENKTQDTKNEMSSPFDMAMPGDETGNGDKETEINSFFDQKIRDLIQTYFLCADNSQYPIYNIERNTRKLSMSEKMFLRNNSDLAEKNCPADNLCEAALEQVFTIMDSLVKSVEVEQVDDDASATVHGKRKGVGKKTKSAIAKSKPKRTRKVAPSTQKFVHVLQLEGNVDGVKREVIDGLKTFEAKLKTAQKFMEAEIRDMLASKNIPIDKKNDIVNLGYTMDDLHDDLEINSGDETTQIKIKKENVAIPKEVLSDVSSKNASLSCDPCLVATNSSLDESYLTANTTFSTPNTTFSTPVTAISTPNAALSHNSTATTLVSTPTLFAVENDSLDDCSIEEIVKDDRKVERMIKEATADARNIENVVNALLSTVHDVNASAHDEIARDMSHLVLGDEEIEILHNLCENCHIQMQPNEEKLKKCNECIEHDEILIKYLSAGSDLADVDVMHTGNLDAYAIDNIPDLQTKQHGHVEIDSNPSDSKMTANANRLSKTDSEISDNDFVDVDDADFDDDDEYDSDGEDLNDMIKDLLRSVNSIEVVMDTVMAKCRGLDGKLDMSKLLSRAMDDELLAILDEKLIELYRHMPGIHKRQMAVWRRQEKWTQFVWQGAWPPLPTPPRSPPPPPPPAPRPPHAGQSLFAVCPGYHVARFREVRRKLVHMIEQQKYFDHIRNSLEKKLTPPRKKSPENTNGNPVRPNFDIDQSNWEEQSRKLNSLLIEKFNFEYIEQNDTNDSTSERVIEASNSNEAIECVIDTNVKTAEGTKAVEPSNSINARDKNDERSDSDIITEPKVEDGIFAKVRHNVKRNEREVCADKSNIAEAIDKSDEVAMLHKNVRSIAKDVAIFESMSPIASSSDIARANDTLERLCQIVDRAKEIGVFQKENDVNEYAKRVVERGRSVVKRGEAIEKRTEMMLDRQIEEYIAANLADEANKKKANSADGAISKKANSVNEANRKKANLVNEANKKKANLVNEANKKKANLVNEANKKKAYLVDTEKANLTDEAIKDEVSLADEAIENKVNLTDEANKKVILADEAIKKKVNLADEAIRKKMNLADGAIRKKVNLADEANANKKTLKKLPNKKSRSKTNVKMRRAEQSASFKNCLVEKSDAVARSSVVDRSSELHQYAGVDQSSGNVKGIIDDNKANPKVTKLPEIFKVDKSCGIEQCYVNRNSQTRSKVAELYESFGLDQCLLRQSSGAENVSQQSSQVDEQCSLAEQSSGDQMSAENVKQQVEQTLKEKDGYRRHTTQPMTMQSISQSQPLSISHTHMGRVINCARRTSATHKAKIRNHVLASNLLIPIQPLHTGPFETYKPTYMEKYNQTENNSFEDTIKDDICLSSNACLSISSLDVEKKSNSDMKSRFKDNHIRLKMMEEFTESMLKEDTSDIEKIQGNIQKYQELHTEYVSGIEMNPNETNSDESIILKHFLAKVNDLSRKCMVIKSNEVEPPEVFQYSENNDETNTIVDCDKSVLSPPLQEISPIKNDIAISKNMKIAFNTNLTKVKRKVAAFSKLLYQSDVMVERITTELALCDQIPTDLNLDAWIRESVCDVDNEFKFLQRELNELDLDIATIEYEHNDNTNYNILISFGDELKKVIKECLSVLTENQLKRDITNVFCVHGIVSKSSIAIVKNFIDRNEDVDFSVVQCIMVELVEKFLDMIDDKTINQVDILPSIQKEISDFISEIMNGKFVMPEKNIYYRNSELKEWKYYLNDSKPLMEKTRTRKSPPKKNRSKKINEELRTILFSSSNLLEAMNEYIEKGEIERFKDSTYTQKEYNKWIANFSSYIIRIHVFNYIGVLYKNYLKASKEGRLRLSLSNLMNSILPKEQWTGSDEFTPGFEPEDASRQINVWLSAWRKYVMYKISGPEIGRLISEKERVIKSSILKSVAKGRASSKIKNENDNETSVRALDNILTEDYESDERSNYCQTDSINNCDETNSGSEKSCRCGSLESEICDAPGIDRNSSLLDCFVFGSLTSQTEIQKQHSEPSTLDMMNLFCDYIDIVQKVTENPKMRKLVIENPDPVLNYIQTKSCSKYGLRVETNLQRTDNTDRSNAIYFMDKLREINMHIYVNTMERGKPYLPYDVLFKKLTVVMDRIWALFNDLIEGKPNISIQTCFRKPCDDTKPNIQNVVPLNHIRYTERNEAEILAGKGLSKIINDAAYKKTDDANQSQMMTSVSDDDKLDLTRKNDEKLGESEERNDSYEHGDFQSIYIEDIDTGMMFFRRRRMPVKSNDNLSDVSTILNTEIDSDDGSDPDILEITDSDDEKDEFNDMKTTEAITPKIIDDTTDTHFDVNDKLVEQNGERNIKKMHVGIEVIHESHSTQTDLRVVEEKIEELCKGIEAASVSQEKSKKSLNGTTNGVQKVTSKKSLLLKTVAKQIDAKTLAQTSLEESKIQKQEYEMAKYTAVALRNAKQTLNAAAFDSIQANQSKEVLEVQNQGKQTPKDPERSALGQKESPASKQQLIMKNVANKRCDTPQHHIVCKAGHCHTCPDEAQQCHVTNGVCTCCYCTVFGHATSAPATNHSSVSSKLGETRERLRTLLHKKRQNFKAQGSSPPPGFSSNDQQSQSDIAEQMSNMNIKECSSRHTTSSESSPGPEGRANTVKMALSNVKCQVLPSKCHVVKCKAPVRCQCQLVKTKYQHNCSAAGKNWVPQKVAPAVRPAKLQGTPRLSKAVIQRKAQGLPSPRAPPIKTQQNGGCEVVGNQKTSQNKMETTPDVKAAIKPITPDTKPSENQSKTVQTVKPNPVTVEKKGLTLDAIKKTEEAVRKTEEIVKIMEDACKINDEMTKNSRNVTKNVTPKTKSAAEAVKSKETIEMNNSFDEMKRNPRLTANSPSKMNEKANCNCDDTAEVSKKCPHTGYTRVPIQAYATSIQNQQTMTPHSPCLENHSNPDDFQDQIVPEDTRDLDKLLEYIEGPIKGIDKGKKKAKKARQKAKKVEQRLMAEQQDLTEELITARKVLEEKRIIYESLQTEFDEVRRELRQQQQQLAKKKGKSKRAARPSPTQQAQIQTTAENMGKLTLKLTHIGEVYFVRERAVTSLLSRLAACSLQLRDVRRDIGEEEEGDEGDSDSGEGGEGAERDDEADPPLQHEEGPKAESPKANSLAEAVKTLTRHAPAGEVAGDKPLVVTIRRGQQGVTLTWAPPPNTPAGDQTAESRHTVVQTQPKSAQNNHLNLDNNKKERNQLQKVDTVKKPSWESALSQINELAKPSGKKERKEKKEKDKKEKDKERESKEKEKDNKKKKCKDKPEDYPTKMEEKNSKKKSNENKNTNSASNKKLAPQPNVQSPANGMSDEGSLTKKQRKQLRRQEAEEKLMAAFRQGGEESGVGGQEGRTQHDDKHTNDKALSKGAQKLQKQQLNSANHQLLLKETQRLKQQMKTTKDNKNKHREETTGNNKLTMQNVGGPPSAKMVSKMKMNENADGSVGGLGGTGGAGGCSIMEQLSCGVQVADLRLPPGITLTRVDPNRHIAKHIPSKPASELLNPIPPPTLPPSAHLITGLPPNASQTHLISGLTHTQAQINAALAGPHPHGMPGLTANVSPAYAASHAHLMTPVPPNATGHIYAAPNVVVLDPRSKDFQYQSKLHIPDAPAINCPKGKKGKKKGKKPNIPQMEYHASKTYTSVPQKNENAAPKMVTLKNPMFFSNQSTNFGVPDRSTLVADGPRMAAHPNNSYNQNNMPPPPPPPNNCQATITPTSNGMYTIRNPMMQLLHKNQNADGEVAKHEEIAQTTNAATQNYASAPESYANMTEHGQMSMNPLQSLRYTQDGTCQTSPKRDDPSNLSQTNTYEGYSLFKNTSNNDSPAVAAPSSSVHYLNSASDTITAGYGHTASYSDAPNVNLGNSSVFSDSLVNKVEPIGTLPRRNEETRTNAYYTPFGTDRSLRSAIFQGSSSERQFDSKAIGSERDFEQKSEELGALLKRLTVGSHLNDEVTIHSVTESKFYNPGGMDAPQNNNGSVEITLISNNSQANDAPHQGSQHPQPISSAVFNRSTKNVWAVGNTDLENVNAGAKAVESLVLCRNSTPSSIYDSNSLSTSTSDSPAVADGHFVRAIGEKPQEMSNFPIGYQARRAGYESANYSNQRTNLKAVSERSDLSIAAERLRDLGMTDRAQVSTFKEHQNFKDMGLVSERSLYGHDSTENMGISGERSIYSTDFRSAYGRDISERSSFGRDFNASERSLYAKDMSVGSERSYGRDASLAYGNASNLGFNAMERTSFTTDRNELASFSNVQTNNLYGNSSGYTIPGVGLNQETSYGRVEEDSLNSYASHSTSSQRLLMNGLRRPADPSPAAFYGDSVFAPNKTITNLSELDSSERDIESFKRFDFYFDPPKNKPKINLNVQDIALQLGRNPTAKENK